MWSILNVGDHVPLKTVLGNIYFVGIVTDPNSPNQFAATMEMYGDTAVVTVPILQGPPGQPGEPQFALRFQNDTLADVPDPDHLPTLTNTEADLGKYWIFGIEDELGNVISTSMFVWYGHEYRQMPVGSQGPPGPYPVISPLVVAEPPGSHNGPSGEAFWIHTEGGPATPTWTLHGAFPQGIQGDPGEALWQAGDVNLIGAHVGDYLAMSADLDESGHNIWKPVTPQLLIPRWYTIPEAAFSSFAGITGSDITVCTYAVPQQISYWKPIIFGEMRVFGAQLDPTPFLIGVIVRLGNASSGPIVASGHGNAWGTINLSPHPSTAANPNSAMTPDNSFARVPPMHTGTDGTLYVQLQNEGFGSLFDFNSSGSGLTLCASPVPPPA